MVGDLVLVVDLDKLVLINCANSCCQYNDEKIKKIQYSVAKTPKILAQNNQKMGNERSQQTMFNWQQISGSQYINKTTSQLIDYQQIPINTNINSNVEQVLLGYRNRLQICKPNVLQLLHYCQVFGNDGACCHHKVFTYLDVYVQGGFTALAQLSKVSPCICADILRGFRNLKQLYGPFQVNQAMVWLDRKHRVKVWLNTNPFINDYVPVRENLMALQVKQIILKQDCPCGILNQQDLSLSNLKRRVQNLEQNKLVDLSFREVTSGRHEYKNKSFNPGSPNVRINTVNTSFNTNTNTKVSTTSNRNIPRDATQSRKNIFYYPPAAQSQFKYPHLQYQSTTPKYSRTDKLSMTQKLYTSKQFEKNDKYDKYDKKPHINFNTVQQRPERKNHSTIISMNTGCSTSKVMFNYDGHSNKGTPNKILAQHNRHSEISSPLQLSQLKPREKVSNAAINDIKKYNKTMVAFQDPSMFYNGGQNNELQRNLNHSLQYHRPSFQSQKSQDIRTPPFQLLSQQQKLGKKSSGQEKNLSFNLEEVRERESSQLSRQKLESMRKEINYQNSYTDRDINGNSKPENEKVRASVESEKIEGSYSEIEYQVPEKTKLLIQKYLLNKEPTDKILTSQTIRDRKVQTKRGFVLNREYFTRNREKMYRISRQSLEQNLNSETIDERISEEAFISRVTDDKEQEREHLQMKRVTSAHSVSKMEKSQKQILKKQMQKIFNFSPHDEEESKIRKKVAQKKAFFADLKKEASKILENQEQ